MARFDKRALNDMLRKTSYREQVQFLSLFILLFIFQAKYSISAE